jgi:hypothetical protein
LRSIGAETGVFYMQIAVRAPDAQAVSAKCGQVFATSDEPNVMASHRELRAEVSADGSGTHYYDPHAGSFIAPDCNLRRWACQISARIALP